MRKNLALVLFAATVALVLPSVLPAQKPPNAPAKDAQRLWDEMARLQGELDNRRFLSQVKAKLPKADMRKVRRQFGIPRESPLAGLPEPAIRLRITDITREIEIISVQPRPAMYYGSDDLKEIYQEVPDRPNPGNPFVTDKYVLGVSNSVVAIVERGALTKKDGQWVMTVDSMHTVKQGAGDLCDFDRFYNAPATKVDGTGFLIAEDVVATAGHVVYTDAGSSSYSTFLGSVYFVFDYVMESEGRVKTTYDDSEVYEGREVLTPCWGAGADWALIRLDSVVTGRTPLEYREGGQVSKGDSVYMIGHPDGMPQKYSGKAVVLENTPCSSFLADLDTRPFNSGSPVFNAETHVVEGILVRDAGDYEKYCECYMMTTFTPQIGLPGVEVVRSTEFSGRLEQPDSVLVRCKLEDELIAAVISEWDIVFMEGGEERFFPYDDAGLQLKVNASCSLKYYPDRGSVWDIKIVKTRGRDVIKMEKACFP
jgi:hypothetical protein